MLFQSRFQSIRSIVTSIIIVLGLLSMVATLITGQVYHSLTQRSQLENIERQLHVEVTKTRQRLKQFSLQLSTLITNSEKFKNSLASGSRVAVHRYFSQLQNIPFMQSGVLNVRYAYLYDENNQQIIGLEYSGDKTQKSDSTVCGKIISTSKPTSFGAITDVFYGLCVYQQKPYMSVRVPYTTAGQNGYLELVSEISTNLAHIDQILNFPIRLRLLDKTTIFVSDNWPEKYDANSVAMYPIKDDFDETVLMISALHHDTNLEEALSYAQLLVISGALVSILIAIIVALLIVKRTVISPVNEVVSSLRKVRDSRQHLGAQVQSRGADEIMQLMDDFNAMSSALDQLYDTLEKMTYTDSLTRLGNRKLFHEKLSQVIKDAEQEKSHFALLLIDLDKFKQVNDTFGHLVGDQLLIETSNRFSEILRQSTFAGPQSGKLIASPVQDLLARLGGDEFAIILPGVNDIEDVLAFARRLCEAIHQPMILEDQKIDFGVSVGIAYYPQHASTMDELIRCADEAMYEAKKTSAGYKLYSEG